MLTKLSHYAVRLAVASSLVGAVTTAANAEAILAIQGFAGASPFYNAAAQEWFIPGAPLTSTSVVSPSGGFWQVNTGTFEWTGNNLNQDLSTDGRADGSFLASDSGDVFRIFGDVFDFGTFTQLAAPGTLLMEGTVSNFRMRETAIESNFLNMDNTVVATFTPTGGFLLNNTDGMNMIGPYTLSISLNRVEQDTAPITDFTNGFIRTAEQIQIGMTQVPEPSSLGMLLLAGLVAVRRRRS